MNYTEDEMVLSVAQAIEIGLGISEMELESLGLTAEENVFFDRGAIVEADFAIPTFNSDYFNGRRTYLTVEFKRKNVTLCAVFGENCKNPVVATHFMERYMDFGMGSSIWKIPFGAQEHNGLVLTSSFKTEDGDVTNELARRIAMLKDEMLTNELRQFIHYFI